MMFSSYSSQLFAACRSPFTVNQQCPFSTSPRQRSWRTKTFYEILDVPEVATKAEIKTAFIIKSKEYHPDVNPDDPQLHQAFIKVSEAYTTLSSTSRRQQYDAKLNGAYTSTYATPGTYSPGNPFGYRDDNYQYYRNAHQSRKRGSPYAQQPIQHIKNPYHKKVVFGTLVFMLLGALVTVPFLHFRFQRHSKHLEEVSRKANKAYSESKERARTNTLKEQLDLLTAHHAFHARVGKGGSTEKDTTESQVIP